MQELQVAGAMSIARMVARISRIGYNLADEVKGTRCLQTKNKVIMSH